MSENMMCPAHKGSTPASREGWDRTFGQDKALVNVERGIDLHSITKQSETEVIKQRLNQLSSDRGRKIEGSVLGTIPGYGEPPYMEGAIKR